MSTERKYHHGDLRGTLLREARALLAEDGIEGLSLRKLADRVGVSRTASYHHFQDKHALLCALAAQGFEALDQMAGHAMDGQPLPQGLAALMQGYLDFALADPERYDLMFGRRLWKLAQPTPELRQVAYDTFRRYAQRIAGGALDVKPDRQRLRLAQASWATLHGLSHLLIDGIYVDVADMKEVSAVALSSLLGALGQGRA